MNLFARRRWPRIEGTVIDKRHIKRILIRYDATSQLVSIDEYLVEFPGGDGEPKRARVTAKSSSLPLQGVPVGSTVPLHTNRKGTRAVFGRFEPRTTRAERKQRERERLARDEARFDAKMRGD